MIGKPLASAAASGICQGRSLYCRLTSLRPSSRRKDASRGQAARRIIQAVAPACRAAPRA